MVEIGIQTKNIVFDDNPEVGFRLMRESGFSCCDFSLNSYLINSLLYQSQKNDFFDYSITDFEQKFILHKEAASCSNIKIHQMHMPYPNYVPNASEAFNNYLREVVAPKSLQICNFFDCRYIVMHGFKLARQLGTEELEWEKTKEFIEFLAPLAKQLKITLCIENIYTSIGNHLVEGPCCDVRKAVRRMEEINQKYEAEVLGFCFDTGHANLVGIDLEEFLTILGGHLKVLHIHDNDGIKDLHQIPYTFSKSRENKSSTDWEGFLRGLRANKFAGVLSFETAPVLSSFPDEMKEDVLKLIASVGRYFQSELNKNG